MPSEISHTPLPEFDTSRDKTEVMAGNSEDSALPPSISEHCFAREDVDGRLVQFQVITPVLPLWSIKIDFESRLARLVTFPYTILMIRESWLCL